MLKIHLMNLKPTPSNIDNKRKTNAYTTEKPTFTCHYNDTAIFSFSKNREHRKKIMPMTKADQMSIQMQTTNLKNTQNLTIPKNILHFPLQKKKLLKIKQRTHNRPQVEKHKAFFSELVTRNPSSALKEKSPVGTTSTPSVPCEAMTLEVTTPQPIDRKGKMRTETCEKKFLTECFLFFLLNTDKETRERRLVTNNQ